MPKSHRPCKKKSKGGAISARSSSQLLGGIERYSKLETLGRKMSRTGGRTMKSPAIVAAIAVAAHLFASQALAACALSPEASHTVVRGRLIRCEDATFYLEASGAYERYERDLEAAVARVGPENRETLLERLGVTPDFPYDDTFEGRVAVVAIDWHAQIVPWTGETSDVIEFKQAPREIRETIRYWWLGSIEACHADMEEASIDLWVYPECCDTPQFGAPVCLIQMNYAERAPDVMSGALDQEVGTP